jgi:hypothetical protein
MKNVRNEKMKETFVWRQVRGAGKADNDALQTEATKQVELLWT